MYNRKVSIQCKVDKEGKENHYYRFLITDNFIVESCFYIIVVKIYTLCTLVTFILTAIKSFI